MILDWEYKFQCLEICTNGLEIIFVLYENLNMNDFQNDFEMNKWCMPRLMFGK